MKTKLKKQRYYKVEYFDSTKVKVTEELPFKNETKLHQWFNSTDFQLMSVEFIGWK